MPAVFESRCFAASLGYLEGKAHTVLNGAGRPGPFNGDPLCITESSSPFLVRATIFWDFTVIPRGGWGRNPPSLSRKSEATEVLRDLTRVSQSVGQGTKVTPRAFSRNDTGDTKTQGWPLW